MAFDPNNLSALTYANGFTLWHYKTQDLGPLPSGYFNEAASMLRVGDVLIIGMGTYSPRVGLVNVRENSNGNVIVGKLDNLFPGEWSSI